MSNTNEAFSLASILSLYSNFGFVDLTVPSDQEALFISRFERFANSSKSFSSGRLEALLPKGSHFYADGITSVSLV
jgi:hypothetical protein